MNLILALDHGRFNNPLPQMATSAVQLGLLLLAWRMEAPGAWLACLVAMAALSIAGWINATRRYRVIEDTPTSRIATCAQGYAELVGRGVPCEPPLYSPLTGLPCLWFHFTTETKQGDKWVIVQSQTSTTCFELDDDTGRCLIDPEGAEILSSRKDRWREGDYRHTQIMLIADEPLYLLGEFRTLGSIDLQLDERADTGALLTEWKRDPEDLKKRFDLDGDGEISDAEWQLARAQARREVSRQHRELRSAPDVHRLSKPRDGRLFLISNNDPDRIARRYALWATFHLLVFFGGLAGFARVFTTGNALF